MRIPTHALAYGTSFPGYRLILDGGCWKPKAPAGDLEYLIDEIHRALKARLFYAAVMLALAVPGICATLEMPDGWSGRDEYKDWFRRHLADKLTTMTADDCYMLRCGVVHTGRSDIRSRGGLPIMFTFPMDGWETMDGCNMVGALQFDAEIFCSKVISAVREWYSAERSSPIVAKNMENIFRLRPEGMMPYVFGRPIIA